MYWVTWTYALLLWIGAILFTFYSVKGVIVHRSIRGSPALLTLYLLVIIQLFMSVSWFLIYLHYPRTVFCYFMDVADSAVCNAIVIIMITRFVNSMRMLQVNPVLQRTLYWFCWGLFAVFLAGIFVVWLLCNDSYQNWEDNVFSVDVYLICSYLVCMLFLAGVFVFLIVEWRKVLERNFVTDQKLLSIFAASEIVQYLLYAMWYFSVADVDSARMQAITISVFADVIPSIVICTFLQQFKERRGSGHSSLVDCTRSERGESVAS